MYQWVRSDIARVGQALLLAVPVLTLLAIEAFAASATPLLRFLVVAGMFSYAVLAVKWIVTARAFRREDSEVATDG